MKAYIICFAISLIFAILADRLFKSKEKKNKAIGIIMLVGIVLNLSFFAGIRSLNLGHDIKSYFSVAYVNFVESGKGIFEVAQIANIEKGFAAYMYFLCLFKNKQVVLFFIELAICMPIVIFAYKRKNISSITFITFIFLMTMYCKSLNLMRQFIAISLIVLSITFFEEKKYKITLVLFLLACLFHETAIISGIVYLIMYICQSDISITKKRIYLSIIFLCVLILTLGFNVILQIIPTKYEYYLTSSYAGNSLSIGSIAKKVLWIGFGVWYIIASKEKNDVNYKKNLSYIMLFLIDFVLYFMSIKIGPAGRLGYYFLYAGYLTFLPNIKDVFKQKRVVNIIVSILLVAFWYNMTIVNFSADGVYPYYSDIIPIFND